jgi:hypothetical protein
MDGSVPDFMNKFSRSAREVYGPRRQRYGVSISGICLTRCIFRARAEDGNYYVLRHDSGQDCWTLEEYRQAPISIDDILFELFAYFICEE